MRNAGLEETQTGIKIAGRNINQVQLVTDIEVIELLGTPRRV